MLHFPRLPTSSLILTGLLSLATFGCHTQPPQLGPGFETVPVRLGSTEVRLAIHQKDPSGQTYLVLHDDEDTAVEVARETLQERGGRLVEIRLSGERLVAFELDGTPWRFDPNRIFTPAGIEATLREHSGSASPAAVAEVERFANAVMEAYGIGSSDLIVTLHNNTDGEYSAASYAPGGDLAADAAAVHLPDGADPDDFFFVTERGLYDALVQAGFPVVLQDNERVTDDGSLSVWAGRRGLPYVNVEAEHGHRERQTEMLEALAQVLPREAEGR